jgi:lipoprotein-releasing system permease protein
MYIPLLISKYLAKRRIAWVSLIAVMLCTAMVLVVISVMSGWLGMFRSSFQGLSGDIVVRGDGLTGFPYYEKMESAVTDLPEATAAVPMIETFGLINIQNAIQDGVKVVGLPMGRIGQVNDFPQSLYLNNPDLPTDEILSDWRAGGREEDEASIEAIEAWAATMGAAGVAGVAGRPGFGLPWPAQEYREQSRILSGGRELPGTASPETDPGIIVGTGVVGIRKNEQGELDRWQGLWPYAPVRAKIVTLALDPQGGSLDLERQKAEFSGWIVDNSRTGVFNADNANVYVDFDLLQRMLGMEQRELFAEIDPDTLEPVGEPIIEPARTGELHVALAEGVPLEEGRAAVERAVMAVFADQPDGRFWARQVRVETWEQRYGDFLAAVEKERALVVTLFGFISIVAVFLILCIFYMIVKEKTRDIGIVKSVGATAGGIAAIFLGYGAVIGLVGGGMGLLLGSLVVWNINEIHDLMGRLLNIQIWSADTYLFDRIPNTVDPFEAAVIFAAAVVSSVIGAVVPAWRAASLRPVEALRFE